MDTTNRTVREGFEEHIRRTCDVIQRTDFGALEKLVGKLHDAYQKGSRVYIFGNGGSAACASHFAEDLAKGILRDLSTPKRLRVLSLADSTPFITALGNDCGYESIFREQLITNAQAGDLAMGISGSGNSPNVLSAIAWARDNGLYTVGITGFEGGRLRPLAHLAIHFPIMDMEIAENAHMVLAHLVVGGLRSRICG